RPGRAQRLRRARGSRMTVAPSPFAELTPPLEAQEAVVEADRCLECGGALAGGDAVEAARVIFSDNLLGGTCARVCPVELLCQGACVLPHDGARPIEIGRLQRYATDVALGERVRLRTRAPFNWLRVSVIGAGPAGLTAAGELAALGYDVTVYDERLEPGGLV